MIEMIPIGNWVYLKAQLYKLYEKMLIESYDSAGGPEFREYVEQVFKTVLRWNQFSIYSNIDIIGNDDELALDLLESISSLDLTQLQDSDYWFDFIYVDSLGSAIVEWHIKGQEQPESEAAYKQKLQCLRQSKLTTIVRLLDVVRKSKGR